MMFDVYQERCPSRKVLSIISNKWVILIIEKLAQRTYRFEALKREIGGISAKVLSHQLKLLEGHGIIIREDNSSQVLNVCYSLSPLGDSLSKALLNKSNLQVKLPKNQSFFMI